MNKNALSAFLGLLFLAPSCALYAAEKKITLVPSIAYGLSALNFVSSTGGTDKSRFNTVNFALTVARDRLYLRINSEIPMGNEFTYGNNIVRQFKREDFGFSVGYYLLDNLSLFGGISYGKTSIISFDGSNSTAYPVYTQHMDTGPFAGINYNVYLGDTSSISLSLAYAAMSGTYVVEDTDPLNGGGGDVTDSGSTTGYSLGLTWSDTFRGKANYFLSYKYKNYNTVLTGLSITKGFNVFSLGFVFPI